MNRVLVFGKNGQLAQALERASLPEGMSLVFSGSADFDLLKRPASLPAYIADFKNISGIINTAAFTAVDDAETSHCAQAYLLNAEVPGLMARACKRRGIPLIHISTDCVFSGAAKTPYKPNAPTNPINFYGLTKLLGEKAIQNIGGRALIVRTTWLFSQTGNNFFPTMLRLGRKGSPISVVDDQTGSPTNANDLATALLRAMLHMTSKPHAKLPPVLHAVGTGTPVSRFDFAREIFARANLSPPLSPVSSGTFGAPAQRPEYCALDSSDFEATFGHTLPKWRDGLQRALSRLKE